MIVRVETVHPTVTIVAGGGRQFEIPTDNFPTTPQTGQSWKLELTHVPTPVEQVDKLNDYLATS